MNKLTELNQSLLCTEPRCAQPTASSPLSGRTSIVSSCNHQFKHTCNSDSQEPVLESPQPLAQSAVVLPNATGDPKPTAAPLITPSSISRRRRHCSAPLLVPAQPRPSLQNLCSIPLASTYAQVARSHNCIRPLQSPLRQSAAAICRFKRPSPQLSAIVFPRR
ncbi:hypothetical protein M0R45_008987 [Rubus argutus]|uniref:Uncharacterized protein n=1 Tax=Rubus argutus TaxID=59490 RepID=A0AAW1Y2U7_RUBAR